MPDNHLKQRQPTVLCRFAMPLGDTNSGHEFCMFEFPGCEGCPNAMHSHKSVEIREDPIQSLNLKKWMRAFPSQENATQLRRIAMEEFVRRQNLALFKERLAEPLTDAEREVLKKFMAEEE